MLEPAEKFSGDIEGFQTAINHGKSHHWISYTTYLLACPEGLVGLALLLGMKLRVSDDFDDYEMIEFYEETWLKNIKRYSAAVIVGNCIEFYTRKNVASCC